MSMPCHRREFSSIPSAFRSATKVRPLLCCSWLAARERTPGLQLDELQALHEAKERTANAWPLWKGELLKCGWEEAAVRLDHAGATRVVVEA